MGVWLNDDSPIVLSSWVDDLGYGRAWLITGFVIFVLGVLGWLAQ